MKEYLKNFLTDIRETSYILYYVLHLIFFLTCIKGAFYLLNQKNTIDNLLGALVIVFVISYYIIKIFRKLKIKK